MEMFEESRRILPLARQAEFVSHERIRRVADIRPKLAILALPFRQYFDADVVGVNHERTTDSLAQLFVQRGEWISGRRHPREDDS